MQKQRGTEAESTMEMENTLTDSDSVDKITEVFLKDPFVRDFQQNQTVVTSKDNETDGGINMGSHKAK